MLNQDHVSPEQSEKTEADIRVTTRHKRDTRPYDGHLDESYLRVQSRILCFQIAIQLQKEIHSYVSFSFFSELFFSAFTQPLGSLCLTSNFVSLDPSPKLI